MFCSNCGNKLDYNVKYCSQCGNKIDNTDIIKPLITNVGIDNSLPKNHNFLITIIFVLIISFLSIGVIYQYQETNKYVATVVYKDYNFKQPLGYTTLQEDGRDSLLIKNSNIAYEFMIDQANYNEYVVNNFSEIKSLLDSKNYKYTSINELEQNNHKMVFAILDSSNSEDDSYNNYAFYMSRINGSDDIVWGYIYKQGIIDQFDAYRLLDIIDNIE